MEEDILYKDFNGIRITSKKFYAGQKAYALEKIKQINIQRVTPNKWRGMALFSLGIFLIVLGSFDVLGTFEWQGKGEASIQMVSLNFIAISAGVLAMLIAILRMVVKHDQFAVKIETTDGKKESIISKNRKYAARLAASLKRAYYRQHAEPKANTLVSV